MAKKTNEDIHPGGPQLGVNANGNVKRTEIQPRTQDKGDDDISFTGYGENEAEVDPNYTYKPVKEEEDDGGDEQGIGVLPEYGGKEDPTETASTQQTSDDDPYLKYLNSELSGATARTKAAQGNYDEAYKAVGSELGAVANLLKPKDREPERKRIRNVAMGQAIGQALAAIFGGAYANNKKTGYGKIVLPEDFASKTLSRAEELREKGLLEDKEYRRLLSNMNLRKAELGLQRATGDLTNAQANERFVQKLIGDYHQQTRKLAGEAAAREARATENANELTWKSEENAKDRSNNITVANIRAKVARDTGGGSGKGSFDLSNIPDDEVLLLNEFLQKTDTRTKTSVDDTGRRTNETVSTKKESWSKDEYASALNQARIFMRRHSGMAEFVNSGEMTWVDVKRLVDMSDADKDRELNDLIKAGKATVEQVNNLKAKQLPKEWIIAKLSTI